MTQGELVLHPRSAKQIDNIIHNLPHALVIEGSIGVGVTKAAKYIAESVGSPEFIILPKKKAKTEFVVDMEDGNVIIEDIRLLYMQTRTKQPGKQVYILDTGLKTMTVGAQNAFLKLLEEPRDDLHFIITTHHVDQLLPTIISRSQRLTLLEVSDKQTVDLITSLGIRDETKIKRLAFVGRGKPALIKRLVDDEELYESRVTIMSDAKTILTGDTYKKLITIQQYRDNRPNSLMLIEDMVYQLRTVIKTNPDKKLIRDIDKYIDTHSRIAAGGNIRLQLASSVL